MGCNTWYGTSFSLEGQERMPEARGAALVDGPAEVRIEFGVTVYGISSPRGQEQTALHVLLFSKVS